MVPFLKDFLNNLSSVQSKQVLRILSQMRDRGEIRSIKDFEEKLASVADLIRKDEIGQRTPPLVFSEGDLLESDAIRTFTEYVRLDLEAALGETERLSNSMRAHNRILAENYFDALESSVAELEAETRGYEILEDQKFIGFTSKLKQWTFDGPISVPGADTDDPFVSSLFVDGRGSEELFYAPPGQGENGLHLAINSKTRETTSFFNRVEILTDSTTPQTALNTSTEENSPIRAIDGDRDTAWKQSVLLTEYPDYTRLIFAPSFIGARRVNALVIDPLADVSMKIVSVSYIDSGGQEVHLPIGIEPGTTSSNLFSYSGPLGSLADRDSDWIVSNKRKIIPVGDIIARKFIITLQQDTANDGEFFYYDGDLGNWASNTQIESFMTGLMRENGGADGIEIPVEFGLLGEANEDRIQARFVEYVFGFKEVSTITREYEPSGLFVPETFQNSKAPNVLALYTDLDYPVGDDTDVEFLLRKENYDSAGSLLDVETIPMLPFGSDSVDERLFLTESQETSSTIKDTGALRFYPDFSESFAVSQSGTLLTLGTDYTISVDGGTTFESVTPPVGTVVDPARCLVKITSPQSGFFYTTSYKPLVSTFEPGGELWLNADHTVRLGRSQTYVFENIRATGEVASCKMGLQILLRANTLNSRVSPYLREAILLGG